MKTFETPVIEIEKFRLLDVIATSTDSEDNIPELPELGDLYEDLTDVH